MARSPSRIHSEAVVGYLYESENDVPWNEIEEAVIDQGCENRRQFAAEEKLEMFLSTEAFAEALEDARGGLTVKHFERARRDLLKLLRNYQDIFDRHLKPERDALRRDAVSPSRTDNGYDREETVEARRIRQALHMIYGSESFSVFKALGTMGDIAPMLGELLRHLEQSPPTDPDDPNFVEERARDPRLAALQAFVEEIWRGASRTPARGNPGYFGRPEVFEYSRWGIPVGPQSVVFRRFTNVLLKEDYTQPQIRQAFRELREAGFRTLEEVCQNEVNTEE